MGHFPILFGLLLAGLFASLALYFRRGSPWLLKRLEPPSSSPQILVGVKKPAPLSPSSLLEKFGKKLGLKKDKAKFQEVKKTLVQAGFVSDRAPSIFMGLKVGLAVALPMLALPLLLRPQMGKVLSLAAFYLLVMLGYFLPNLVLGHLVETRKKKIKESLPDALDLLVVCVEAGQGLNAALKRVADEVRLSCPTLSQELLMVNLEINAGQERDQALRNLAERTGVEEVASLCNILIQSDRFGTSVAQALKVQSETLRTTRRQKLEELVAKTTVKLVFPLILLIFPAILVVILGPAAIRIADNILK